MSDFLLGFADALMSAGTQTSRVARNVERLAGNFGYRAEIITLPKTIVMTLSAEGKSLTRVKKISPPRPDFSALSELKILSWEAYRNGWDLRQCERRFAEIAKIKKADKRVVAVVVAFGNAAFCRLFGGFYSIPLVFFCTLAGFAARSGVDKLGVGTLPRTFAAAFASSLMTGTGALLFDFKTSIAISTSVLYLVPGVPLLNAVIDIFDGNALAGFSRLANASSIILAMALGLLASLAILGGKKLLLAGLFAAVGHSLRLWLMLGCGMNICPATLIGAFAIGILGFLAGRISGCPSEIFTFPALLPMIPGLYAYKAVLAAIKFLSESPGSELSGKCLSEFFFNAITSAAIMLAIVIGAAASVFIDTLSARIENRKMLAGLRRGPAQRAGKSRSA